jgi:hypothetical protein
MSIKTKARAGLREIQPGEFRSPDGQDGVLTGEALLLTAKQAGLHSSAEFYRSKPRREFSKKRSGTPSAIGQRHFRGGGRGYAGLPR